MLLCTSGLSVASYCFLFCATVLAVISHLKFRCVSLFAVLNGIMSPFLFLSCFCLFIYGENAKAHK